MKFGVLARSYLQHLQTGWQSIRVNVIELNLFKTSTMRTDPFERTTLMISTRIYLVILCLSMCIIVLFTWLNVRVQNVTIENPSRAKFEELQRNYPRSLECPCSVIVIPHGSFISVSPQFHPVCTSTFISDDWINFFYAGGVIDTDFIPIDIFVSGHKYFITLAALCELVKTTVLDASFIFNQSLLITGQTLPDVELMDRAYQAFNQFKSNTAAEFKRILALIRSQTTTMYTAGHGDVIWIPSPWINSTTIIYFEPIPVQIDNCSCGLSDECKEPLVMYNYTDYYNFKPLGVQFKFSDIFVSCFSIPSLLQSSLKCFFNETCLGFVQEKLNALPRDIRYPLINASLLQKNSTRFSPDQSVQEIVNEMMIERWGEDIQYSQYYEQCNPKLCSYFVTAHNDALYIFTTMIGLFGGLSVALKIIVPLIVGWIRNRMRPRVQIDNITGKSSINEESYVIGSTDWRIILSSFIPSIFVIEF